MHLWPFSEFLTLFVFNRFLKHFSLQ